MSYQVGLYTVPEAISSQVEDLDKIRNIVYSNEYEEACLKDDNFSGSNGSYFESIFGITLTNNYSCKFITKEEFVEIKIRLVSSILDEYQTSRIQPFIDAIEKELEEGKTLFFWCD